MPYRLVTQTQLSDHLQKHVDAFPRRINVSVYVSNGHSMCLMFCYGSLGRRVDRAFSELLDLGSRILDPGYRFLDPSFDQDEVGTKLDHMGRSWCEVGHHGTNWYEVG